MRRAAANPNLKSKSNRNQRDARCLARTRNHQSESAIDNQRIANRQSITNRQSPITKQSPIKNQRSPIDARQ
jgi:hypothetical protein